MKSSKKKMLLFFLGVLIGIAVACTPTTDPGEKDTNDVITDSPQPIQSAPSDSSTPITTQLVLSNVPGLEEVVDLTFTVSSAMDAPETTVTIVLPDDAEVVEGELAWVGDLKAGETHTLEVKIQISGEGNKTIEGKAMSTLENGDVWADASYLYFHVSQEGGTEGFKSDDSNISTDSEKSP